MSMDNVPPGYVERPTLEDYLKPYEEETARLREQLKVAVGALKYAATKAESMAHMQLIFDDALAQIKDLEK